MKRRMLDGAIWSNEKFAELPPMARLLMVGLITLADDQGRTKSHPAFLRSQIFPYDDVTLNDVEGWLNMIAETGMFTMCSEFGKDYAQIVKEDSGAVDLYGSEWIYARRDALKRDGYECVDCASPELLEVHHILPIRVGGTHEIDNLKTLCRRCHLRIHAILRGHGLSEDENYGKR